MNLVKALQIATEAERALTLAGPNASVGYGEYDLMAALAELLEHTRKFTVRTSDLHYQKRLYTALKARHAKLCKETGRKVPDDVQDIAAEVTNAAAS